MQGDFLEEVRAKILDNLSDEEFGVSELAAALHLSRSTLLRRIKKETGLSVSLFIREQRLISAMHLLQKEELTVSEVSYQVGFSSVSYFVKCFREHYGYPPGQVSEQLPRLEETNSSSSRLVNPLVWVGIVLTTVILVFGISFITNTSDSEVDKSIAVLPFKNESRDSSNVYFINGLMESTLRNLQRLEDLRVVSRTSSEIYRNSNKTAPLIAEELAVRYLVEGSGQKVGDRVLLHIQLIDAKTDRPLWSEEYKRDLKDVFEIQKEVAFKISEAIKVAVSPSEREFISIPPTDNIVAYDYYLQAMESFHIRTDSSLAKAIELLEKAVKEDSHFALAYANTAIAYYLRDLYHEPKLYTEEINHFSDQALLYDPKLDLSLMAKACYYLQTREFRLALPHLEKALEYNPNSGATLHMLSDFYAFHVPNTAKFLEYALRRAKLELPSTDSIAQSFSYLQLSNALVQAGFFDQALEYINKSLDYYPSNYYAPHLKVFVKFAKHKDYTKVRKEIVQLWKQDTTRLDILQDAAKIYATQELYDSAYYYYDLLIRIREEAQLNIYHHEDIRMAAVYRALGHEAKAAELYDSYVKWCESDKSDYKGAIWAAKYAYEGDVEGTLTSLKDFAQQHNFQYWFLLLKDDPCLKEMEDNLELQSILADIDERFWADHESLKFILEDQNLL